MDISARLGLPLLVPGQAQKELFHNEALQALDVIIHGVVQGSSLINEPPASPQIGETYLVGATPVAAWQGYPNHVACWTEGGWRFRAPFQGLELPCARLGTRFALMDTSGSSGSWPQASCGSVGNGWYLRGGPRLHLRPEEIWLTRKHERHSSASWRRSKAMD
jgi:hypothetical protein